MHDKPHLFILAGHAGTGKNRLARQWLKHDVRTWVFLDKDTIGTYFAQAMLPLLGCDPMDRDSPEFVANIRPVEYAATYAVAQDNLVLGHNVLVCAPMGRECFDEDTWNRWVAPWKERAHVHLVWMHIDPEMAKERIQKRNHPMDAYKLSNWDEYSVRRYEPRWISVRLDTFWCDSGINNDDALKWLSRRCRHVEQLSVTTPME